MIRDFLARLFPFFYKQNSGIQAEGESASTSLDKLTRTLDTAPAAYALTVKGIITEANEHARNQIGLQPGGDIREFCENFEQWNTLINSDNRTKQSIIGFKMKNGEVRRYLCSATAIHHQLQESYILWGVDVEHCKRKNEPHDSTDCLLTEESKQLTDKILMDIFHEIRTPISGIIDTSDLLLGDKISGRQIQHITEIKKSAEFLLSTVDVVLDYANISEDKIQIMPVDIELCAFLRNIAAMIQFSARMKGLEFIDQINIKSPEYVRVDDTRLKQVLLNLLSNAIKFTKSGSVSFFAKIEDGKIQFKVRDTGIGVKPEDVPRVFTPFRQAEEGQNLGVKGTGLNLPISKKLVEMMGGAIWLESEYNFGSYFYVTIPYTPSDVSDVNTADAESEYIYAPTANILLVDDIQTNLTVTTGLLRLWGITADVAMSGREAINHVREKDYDIIFMDYMMPEMDGVEAMKIIRGLGEKYEKWPIIALTANKAGETRDYLLGAGMDDFLAKPLDKGELLGMLKKWIPDNKLETVAASANRDIPGQDIVYSEILKSASLIEGVDIKLALSRISGMQDLLEMTLIQVSNSITGHLKELDEQLSSNNLKDFAVRIHGMKSSLANIGAMRHSELAAELEILSKAGNMTQCAEKFAVFADIMSGFASKLNAILLQADAKDLPLGDRSLLAKKVTAAVSSLEKYELDEARSSINEVLCFRYDDTTDKLLRDVNAAVVAVNYKKAISLLKSVDL